MYSSMANRDKKKQALAQAKSSAEETATHLGDAASQVKDDLYEVANVAGRKVRLLLDNAASEASHAKEVVAEQIKEKPIQSSLIALGIGVVIGALLRR